MKTKKQKEKKQGKIISRHGSFAKLAIFSAIFMTLMILNLATALAYYQSHNLSEIRNIDANLDMGSYQIAANRINASVVQTTVLYDDAFGNFFEVSGCGDNTHVDSISSLGTVTCSANSANGDITGVTAGNGLSGGGASGSVTLDVGAGSCITVGADDVGVTSGCVAAATAGSATTATTATNIAGGSAGAIPFQTGASTTGFDAGNLYWDDAGKNLGINTNNPQSNLSVNDDGHVGAGIYGYSYPGPGVVGTVQASHTVQANTVGTYGAYNNNSYGYLGSFQYGVRGYSKAALTSYGVYGEGGDYGVYGTASDASSYGVYGDATGYGVYGKDDSGHYGYLGGNSYGAYGWHSAGNYGFLGSSTTGVFGQGTTWGGYFQGDGYFSGDVGIGTSSPQNRLDVEGGAVIGATYSGTDTAPTNGLLVEGNVGIGTNSPLSNLSVGDTGVSEAAIYGRRSSTGTDVGVYGASTTSGVGMGVFGTVDSSPTLPASGDYAVYGSYNEDRFGYLGHNQWGVYGQYRDDTYGLLGGNTFGAYGRFNSSIYGYVGRVSGSSRYGLYGYSDVGGGTNYGVYGRASSGDNNYGGYFVGDGYFSGNLGVGDSSPERGVDVYNKGVSVCSSGDGSCPTTDNAGDIYASSRSGASIDIAEWIKTDEKMEAGDVVIIDVENPGKVKKSYKAEDTAVAGIVSTKPHLTMGEEYKGPDAVRLAIAGRVPVKVTAENGAIVPGDMLTTSSIQGYAMKCGQDCRLGTVLGKALEPLKSGQGKITALVTLQ